jgi:hypothetical protein
VFVANCGRFEEIVGVFFGLGLGDVFLDVLVEPHCLVQVDGFEVVEVDVVVDFSQLGDLLLAQHAEGLFFGNERVGEESE